MSHRINEKREVVTKFDIFEQLPHNVWTWLVKYLADRKCEVCNSSKEKLESHHVDRDNRNNALYNGACLCYECHDATHKMLNERDRAAKDHELSVTLEDSIELPFQGADDSI